MRETQLIDDARKELGYVRCSFITKVHGIESDAEDLKYDSIPVDLSSNHRTLAAQIRLG
jgi:hypothetical protein